MRKVPVRSASRRRSWALLTVILAAAAVADAARMPQDNWYMSQKWGAKGAMDGQFNEPSGLAIATDGRIYVADAGNHRIQVFEANGAFVRQWGGQGMSPGMFSRPVAIAVRTDGRLYVLEEWGARIQAFDPPSTFPVVSWGTPGVGAGQLQYATGIALAAGGRVYVSDSGNHRIQVFEAGGAFVNMWGANGSVAGQFINPRGIAFGPDGLLYVADLGNSRVQVFTPDGAFVRQFRLPGYWPRAMAFGPDRCLYMVGEKDYDHAEYAALEVLLLRMLDLSGRMICQWGAAGPMDGQFNRPVALCVQSDGGLILADTGNNRLQAFARRYRTVGPPVPAQVPLPSVVSSRQRPGTTIVDVEYEVVDPDSPTVHVGALAFVDGAENFRNLLRVTTLEEGTRTNLGANVPTGQRRRIAWNAGADWPADYGNVQVEILANDGRGLVDFHFLSLPGQGADPTLVISRSPVTTNDLLSCWYWLVATNDPAIALSDGRIYGAGGADNGRLLAWDAVLTNGVSVTTNAPTDIRTNVAVRLLEGYTTPAGRQFLFRRMNVREATEAEVQRAMAANTPGFTNRWTPRISVGPDRFPRRVNQYGFDTGNWGPDAWWVVPLYAVK